MLIAVCVLRPAQLEHVLGFTSFRLRFGGVLRGQFVPRTCFDRVPAGTRLFRTRSDYKKWCVPRTCSRWNCTENKCERHIRVKKQRNLKTWDQLNYLVITGFRYIQPLYNTVPLYLVIFNVLFFNFIWFCDFGLWLYF